MHRALIVQQVPHEGPGLIGVELRRAGFKADFVRAYSKDRFPRSAAGYSALVVLGGPMGVYEEDEYPFIKDEIKLLESALKDRVPTLGVCLGAQLLARAAGSAVYKGPGKEIGFYKVRVTDEGARDGLLKGLPREFDVFQWHGDTFDVTNEEKGSVNLASSPLFPNQLIRVGKNAYGVQFHLEVDLRMVREWIEVNDPELKTLKGVIDPEAILKEAPKLLPDILRHGSIFVRRFLRLASTGAGPGTECPQCSNAFF
jgi:GMP synthase-like glutamine amidotransferase